MDGNKFEINSNIDAEEGLPDTEIARKFQEAIKKEKVKKDPNYKGDNPETSEEIINDLNKMGNVKKPESGKIRDSGVFGVYKEPEEKVEELEKKPFVQEDSEKLVKIAMGANVFEKPDKELEKPKPHHGSALDKQIKSMALRLKSLESSSELFNKKATLEQKEERQKLIETLKHGIEEAKLRKEEISKKIKDKKSERTEIKIKQPEIKSQAEQPKKIEYLNNKLKIAEKDVDRARRNKGTEEQIKERQERVEIIKEEIKKAEEISERGKNFPKISGGKEIKTRLEVQADVAERQPETYGKSNKEKEIKREQETQKENMPDLTTPKEESAIAELLERFRELRVKIEIMLSQFKEAVKEFEEKKIDSKEKLIERASEIDRATLISLIENKEGYLGGITYNAYKNSFMEIDRRFTRAIDSKLAELSEKAGVAQKEPKEELDWIMELSPNIEKQEKIEALFNRILELARRVDAYQGLPEESLRKIAENKVKSGF